MRTHDMVVAALRDRSEYIWLGHLALALLAGFLSIHLPLHTLQSAMQ